jgi:AmmeMemoRadiSam system protein B/AmmeMemoRadiSam system protein A
MSGAFDFGFLILDLRFWNRKSQIANRKYFVPLFLLVFGSLIFLIGCGNAKGKGAPQSAGAVREATHADGAWYPSAASELRETVDGYLAKVKKEPVPGRVVALIVPHAGYRFCGQVAAYAYKQVEGMQLDTIVLVGPSHHYGFPGASVYESGVYRNPLGDVEVDSVVAKQLMDGNDAIKFAPRVHIPEHSLENQIPFLQRTLSEFKIVPILMQDFSKKNCDMLSKALVNALKDKNVLLIASTDMSHFPVYDEAVKADKVTMSAIETMDTDLIRERLGKYLERGVRELHCMLCGRGPVLVVMAVAKELGADSVKILKYANSGDVPIIGDKNRVVGYMAAMLYDSEGLDTPLNKGQQEELLKLARESIETYLRTGEKKRLKTDDERLKIKQGAFVTLRKHGDLRGCIGHIIPREPLCDTVADMAIAAATEDPRFSPVSLDEMKVIDIDISVLSIPRRVQSADEIELGKHGVIVRRGLRQGVYLPQVATETGWDKETFLETLCWSKAGLPKDAWKDKDTELVVFTAQVFEEE